MYDLLSYNFVKNVCQFVVAIKENDGDNASVVTNVSTCTGK